MAEPDQWALSQGCCRQGQSRRKQKRSPLDPLSTGLAATFVGFSRGRDAEGRGLPGIRGGYWVKKENDGDPIVTCQIPFSPCQSGFKRRCTEELVRVAPCYWGTETKPRALMWMARGWGCQGDRTRCDRVSPPLQFERWTRCRIRRVELSLFTVNPISCNMWGHVSRSVTAHKSVSGAGMWQQAKERRLSRRLSRREMGRLSLLSFLLPLLPTPPPHPTGPHSAQIPAGKARPGLTICWSDHPCHRSETCTWPPYASSFTVAKVLSRHYLTHQTHCIPARGVTGTISLFQRTGGRNAQDVKGLLSHLQ